MGRRHVLCRVGLHKWVVHREPPVKPYVWCDRCEKAKMVDTRPENVAGQFGAPKMPE